MLCSCTTLCTRMPIEGLPSRTQYRSVHSVDYHGLTSSRVRRLLVRRLRVDDYSYISLTCTKSMFPFPSPDKKKDFASRVLEIEIDATRTTSSATSEQKMAQFTEKLRIPLLKPPLECPVHNSSYVYMLYAYVCMYEYTSIILVCTFTGRTAAAPPHKFGQCVIRRV